VQSPAIIVVGEVVAISDAEDKLAGWAKKAEAMHGFSS
jgi:uroporphyrin-III C-methyltransferase